MYARSKVTEAAAANEQTQDFEAFFKTHYEKIARVIARIAGDRASAEDLAMEVFWTLWQNSQIRGPQAGGWLYRTAVHRALYELRKRARHARYQRFFTIGAGPPNPEELHAATEEQSNVRQVLAAIKPRHAELLLLRSNGFSYEELATALDLHPASVGTLIVRAQTAFRKEYTRLYGEPRNRS
jgi:RNA polymerase sigma-70 factor, ECF subfamily